MRITEEIRMELEGVRLQHPDGRLTEAAVLERATNPGSPLHEVFTWDDVEAGAEWRLHEARTLIRQVRVTLPTAGNALVHVRAYVSLASDRLGGGGYRPLQGVLSDRDRRDELLRTAMAELQAFQRRYMILSQELAPLFEAIGEVVAA